MPSLGLRKILHSLANSLSSFMRVKLEKRRAYIYLLALSRECKLLP